MKKCLGLERTIILFCGIIVTSGCCGMDHGYSTCTCGSDLPRIEPTPITVSQGKAPVTAPVYANVPETPKRVPAPPVMSHADDYAWLDGVLEYAPIGSGHWKLRFAPVSQDDHFGGSVVLDSDVRLDQFQDGDSVHVEGELVRSRVTVYLSGPLYRVHSIRRIGRDL